MKYLASLLIAVLSACESLGVRHCDDILIPGIRVTVVDSVSGAIIDVPDGAVIASSGAYADTARLPDRGPRGVFFVVDDRPGIYQVRVTAAGYAAWHREGVRVPQADRCHVQTVDVVARLRR
jgi:hypothetical protein